MQEVFYAYEKYIELVKELSFEISEVIQEKEKLRPTLMVNSLRSVGSCSLYVCLLFLLYINDLLLASQINTTPYADDTYLMMSDLNLTSLQNRINIE